MSRTSRLVVPGVPHHITQRGVRRMQVFFSEEDYYAYLRTLLEQTRRHRVEVWAYCLMPNHVHLVAVPADPGALARALGQTHCRFAREVNRHRAWQGHLWQERFWSCPLDERHAFAAARYVLLNPVRAGLVAKAEAWPFSSARAHLGVASDELVDPAHLASGVGLDPSFLRADVSDEEARAIRRHSNAGRPLGTAEFVEALERRIGRPLELREHGGNRRRVQ